MEFSKEMVEILNIISLASVATSSKDYVPNVSLKGIVDYDAQEGILYFLDLFSKKTRANLRENPRVAVALVDYESYLGYQFKGNAELIDSGPEFEKYVKDWEIIEANKFRERLDWNFSKVLAQDLQEFYLPEPKYLVKIKVNEIIDLAAFKKELV